MLGPFFVGLLRLWLLLLPPGFFMLRLQHLHVFDHHLGRIPTLAFRRVPRPGLAPTLDVDETPGAQVAADDLSQVPKGNQAVEVGELAFGTVFVLARVGLGGQANVGDLRAGGRRPNLRIGHQSADQDDLVDHCSDLLSRHAAGNHGVGSTGRPLRRTSKCKCGPVDNPLEPTSPSSSPARTASPSPNGVQSRCP